MAAFTLKKEGTAPAVDSASHESSELTAATLLQAEYDTSTCLIQSVDKIIHL
jgi:hypothetical protein